MFEIVAIIFGATCLSGLVLFYLRDRRLERKRNELLTSRPPFTYIEFAATYFSDSPERGDVAIQLRKLAEENLQINLDGLRPNDRLDEDLCLEMLLNPEFFRAISEKLNLAIPHYPSAEYESLAQRLITFDDLVNFVTAKSDLVHKKD